MKKVFLGLVIFILIGYIACTNKKNNTIVIKGVDSTEVIVDSILQKLEVDSINTIVVEEVDSVLQKLKD